MRMGFTGASHRRSQPTRAPVTFVPGDAGGSRTHCAVPRPSQPRQRWFGSPCSRWGRSGRHGTQRPGSCRGSWGNKPLETPSVSGSGDIVSDLSTLHPFRALAAVFSALPGSTFQPPARSDLMTARSDAGCGKGRGAERGAARLGEIPAELCDQLSPCPPGRLVTGHCVEHACAHGALPALPAGSGGELPGHAPRLISECFPGRPQPDPPEVAQPALNGSGFHVGGRWAPHKGPSPLQAGLSTCLIKS